MDLACFKVRSSYGPLAYFSDIFISGKNVVFSDFRRIILDGLFFSWSKIAREKKASILNHAMNAQ